MLPRANTSGPAPKAVKHKSTDVLNYLSTREWGRGTGRGGPQHALLRGPEFLLVGLLEHRVSVPGAAVRAGIPSPGTILHRGALRPRPRGRGLMIPEGCFGEAPQLAVLMAAAARGLVPASGSIAATTPPTTHLPHTVGEVGLIHSWMTPEFSHLGIVTDDAAGRRVFSGISHFPIPCVPALLHTLDPTPFGSAAGRPPTSMAAVPASGSSIARPVVTGLASTAQGRNLAGRRPSRRAAAGSIPELEAHPSGDAASICSPVLFSVKSSRSILVDSMHGGLGGGAGFVGIITGDGPGDAKFVLGGDAGGAGIIVAGDAAGGSVIALVGGGGVARSGAGFGGGSDAIAGGVIAGAGIGGGSDAIAGGVIAGAGIGGGSVARAGASSLEPALVAAVLLELEASSLEPALVAAVLLELGAASWGVIAGAGIGDGSVSRAGGVIAGAGIGGGSVARAGGVIAGAGIGGGSVARAGASSLEPALLAAVLLELGAAVLLDLEESSLEPTLMAAVLLELKASSLEPRLTRSPPTKANWVQSPSGSPDFRKWESCRTMPLVGGFSRGSPVSPPLHSGAAPYSLQSPSSALKTSLLRAAQISSLTNERFFVGSRAGGVGVRVVYTGFVERLVGDSECCIVGRAAWSPRRGRGENRTLRGESGARKGMVSDNWCFLHATDESVNTLPPCLTSHNTASLAPSPRHATRRHESLKDFFPALADYTLEEVG
ncbi:hypothetical protein PR048_026398 [Dryococelus australis]|uniref:Uncharacterized protein n=1 Tax=Dryococelus australis TaxID=614101 RepID=A0ABQ9GLA5_9NEOP|nr:hypothetical protein PR048_026398 [Dryococelus australis]